MAEEFEGELECLGENTEKYITFSVPIKKETTKKDKNGNGKITKISYKIKTIDSCRFMSASLSNLIVIVNPHGLDDDLPFLPERMKIGKCKKLVCNLYDKKNYVVHIRSLKQALNHGLILKKVHRLIQFNQEA